MMRPLLLPVLLCVLVMFGASASASAHAAVRTATINDPMDAQDTTPSLDARPVTSDITQVLLSYDDVGTVSLAVTFAGDSDVPPAFTVTLSCSDAPPFTATLRRETDFADGWEDHGTGKLDGFDGTITSLAGATAGSRTMTGSFTHGALANRNYRCLSGSWTERGYREREDTVSGWFAGHEPMVVTATGARAEADKYLRAKLGARYAKAGSRYLKCPREQLVAATSPLNPDEDSDAEADTDVSSAYAVCMFYVRSGTKATTGTVSVHADDDARVLKVVSLFYTYTRRWRSCGHALRANHPCEGMSLMASDIESAASRRFPQAPAARSTVFSHGTGLAGFESLTRYRCRTRSRMMRGNVDGPYRRSTATCSNAVGERFQYSFNMA